jgi:hypothetical protein
VLRGQRWESDSVTQSSLLEVVTEQLYVLGWNGGGRLGQGPERKALAP